MIALQHDKITQSADNTFEIYLSQENEKKDISVALFIAKVGDAFVDVVCS